MLRKSIDEGKQYFGLAFKVHSERSDRIRIISARKVTLTYMEAPKVVVWLCL